MTKISLIFIVFTTHLLPQSSNPYSSLDNTAEKIYQGISESVGWYDIPFFTFVVAKNSFFLDDDEKIIRISPFSFDKNLARNVGKNGRESAGSMDQNTIPSIILYSRAAITIAENIISPGSVSKNDYKKLFLFYKSMVYTHALTELAKNLVVRERPDRSDTRSFFSGHTSITFAAASFLYRELDDYIDNNYSSQDEKLLNFGLKSASFAVLYGWAGYVAYSRMYDNKHYFSDIILGAAAGTIISNLVYNIYLDKSDSLVKNFNVGIVNNNPSVSFNLMF
ncbi:MAG: phosphatase PAP2 family protein [Ignavibacteriaceae bacterium]